MQGEYDTTNYNIGDRVKFVNYNTNKLDSQTHEPYRIGVIGNWCHDTGVI